MASAVFFDKYPCLAGSQEAPPTRGVFTSVGLIWGELQILPTDPIATRTLTLNNILVNSEVFLLDANGNTLASADPITTTTFTANYSVYNPQTSGFYVIMLPGYKYIRAPIAFSLSAPTISIYQQVDAAYSTT